MSGHPRTLDCAEHVCDECRHELLSADDYPCKECLDEWALVCHFEPYEEGGEDAET
jgi:hypothetical protein